MRLGTERMAYKKEDYHRQEKENWWKLKKKGLAHHFWSDVKKRKKMARRKKDPRMEASSLTHNSKEMIRNVTNWLPKFTKSTINFKIY